MKRKTIAVFDFDGTITQKDTFLEFIKFSKGNWQLYLGLLFFLPLLVAMKVKIYPNWKAKQRLFSYFYKGVSIEIFNHWGLEFGLGANPKTTKGGTQAAITWRQAGEEIVLLTVTNGICSNVIPFPVIVHPQPQPDFSYQPHEIYSGTEVRFINETPRQQGTHTYYWDFAGDNVFTQTTYNNNDDVFFTYDQAGNYTAQLHVVDNLWGCKNSISIPVVVNTNPNCALKFPNAFTPDKMNNNTFHAAYEEGVLEWGYELRIFDRWGKQVWNSTDKSERWDGRYRGEFARQDVYVYHCKAVCEDTDANGKHRELHIKGDVTVIR